MSVNSSTQVRFLDEPIDSKKLPNRSNRVSCQILYASPKGSISAPVDLQVARKCAEEIAQRIRAWTPEIWGRKSPFAKQFSMTREWKPLAKVHEEEKFCSDEMTAKARSAEPEEKDVNSETEKNICTGSACAKPKSRDEVEREAVTEVRDWLLGVVRTNNYSHLDFLDHQRQVERIDQEPLLIPRGTPSEKSDKILREWACAHNFEVRPK